MFRAITLSCLFLGGNFVGWAQFKEIGPAPYPPPLARQKIRSLLEQVNSGNSQQTIKTLSDLLVWYRDLFDEQLVAAWQTDAKANLAEVIDKLADLRVASGIVESSWRQQRQVTFSPAYTPVLERLMYRYPDSAKPFLDDLLASGQQLDLSMAESEAVCRILLDMPDIRTWKRSALQILPRYASATGNLLAQDLRGDDVEKRNRATVWIAGLKAADPRLQVAGATTPAKAPRAGVAQGAPPGKTGEILKPLDPVTVDHSKSIDGKTPAVIEFLNHSRIPVDVYWIDYGGNRTTKPFHLPPGGRSTQNTFLTHKFLVVASGTGGTIEHGTGRFITAFEAVTPNPTRDPAIRDTAIVTDQPPGSGGAVTDATGAYEASPAVSGPSGQEAQGQTQPANSTSESLDGTLRLLAEKFLLMEIPSGNVLRFRLTLNTEFRGANGRPVRDSLMHPGDHISVDVNPADVETAIDVVLVKSGTNAERDAASTQINEARISTPDPSNFNSPRERPTPDSGRPTLARAQQAGDVYRAVGNGVSGPAILTPPNLESTEIARKLLAQGFVYVGITIQRDGTPADPKVVGPMGYGLDENALAAIRKARFKPAMKDGNPVVFETTAGLSVATPDRGSPRAWHSGPMVFDREPGVTVPVVKDGTMPVPLNESSNESVILDFTVDPTGSVKDIHSTHGSAQASQLLTGYLATWKFQSALKEGKAVEAAGRVIFVKGDGDEATKTWLSPPASKSQSAMDLMRLVDGDRTAGTPLVVDLPSRAINTPARAGQVGAMLLTKDGQGYVWVRPGSFTMGCSKGDRECAANEKPPHEERIKEGFWLGRVEVNQAAYQRVTGANPSAHKGNQLPVENVTYDEAAKFCAAIGGRLPSEAEWEYAARAGTMEARYGAIDEIAWYLGNSENVNHPGARKRSNAFGLYDMLGNLWEWVADSYEGSGKKVVRGGARSAKPSSVRASYRMGADPANRSDDKGFRCAGGWPPLEPSSDERLAEPGLRVGNGVSAPAIIYRVEPAYSEEARKAKSEGSVLISIIVDAEGRARNVKVIRKFGLGLDENAVEAVRLWRFIPAQKDGKPVASQANIEVNFRLL
jgi:formylglycine-generating enzyme